MAQSVAPATGQSPGPAPSATATPVFAPPPSFVVSRDDRLSSDAVLEPPELASIEGVDLSSTWRRAKAIVASLPDREWLTTSLADELEADPFAAFAWVRDHIGFDPYAGELRGAAGTLTGRAGNSLDRALLLQRLLDLMVVQSRLVDGTLDEAGAQAVVERSFDAPRRRSLSRRSMTRSSAAWTRSPRAHAGTTPASTRRSVTGRHPWTART